jgi:hypothetical protein
MQAIFCKRNHLPSARIAFTVALYDVYYALIKEQNDLPIVDMFYYVLQNFRC